MRSQLLKAAIIVYIVSVNVETRAGETCSLPRFTNAWHLLTSGRPADAVDAYRIGFSTACPAAVTAAPVAYAQALANFAAALAELQRYEDALSLLNSACMLARSRYIDAERQYYLCRMAARMGDWEAAADHAEQCIRIDPDHVPFAFHFLALRLHAHRRYRQAIDTWLDGLYGMPLEHAPAYLDAAMGFWKNIEPDQVERLYDTLTALAVNGSLTHSRALQRVLAERVKLQSLYPDRFPVHDPRALINTAGTEDGLTGIIEETWTAVATPQWAIVSSLLTEEPLEQMLNQALEHLARGRRAEANVVLRALMSNYEMLRAGPVRVDGWPLAHAVDALALSADEWRDSDADRTALRASAARVVMAVQRGNTPVGDLWYLLETHGWRLLDATRRKDQHTVQDALDAMRSIAPDSIYVPEPSMLSDLLGAQSFAQKRAVFERILRTPHPMPSSHNWLVYNAWLRECINTSTTAPGNATEFMVTDTLLDGLEHSYAYDAQSLLPQGGRRPAQLSDDPLFSALVAQINQNNVTAAHVKRLQRFLERYGVSVPALPDEVPLIWEIKLWRQKAAGLLTRRPMKVTVIADARAARDCHELWLWTDSSAAAVPMTQTATGGIWEATMTVPAGTFALRYGFYTSREDIPSNSFLAGRHCQRIIDSDSGCRTIRATLPGEKPTSSHAGAERARESADGSQTSSGPRARPSAG
jgi:tetratricopeptide (TPR) repeat protein